MSEETTTAPAETPPVATKKKARRRMAQPKKTKSESSGATGIRVSNETAVKVNKLAAQIQLKTGERTKAGDAVEVAVSKMLKE